MLKHFQGGSLRNRKKSNCLCLSYTSTENGCFCVLYLLVSLPLKENNFSHLLLIMSLWGHWEMMPPCCSDCWSCCENKNLTEPNISKCMKGKANKDDAKSLPEGARLSVIDSLKSRRLVLRFWGDRVRDRKTKNQRRRAAWMGNRSDQWELLALWSSLYLSKEHPELFKW